MKASFSIKSILYFQLVLILLLACGIFLGTFFFGEKSVEHSKSYGDDAVATCFDQYIATIETIGEDFVKDISLQVKNHVIRVLDGAEAKARTAATAVERTGYMQVMQHNGWHGSRMLPSFGWMILGQLEQQDEEVVADLVIASLNSTEEFNNWVWFGLASRSVSSEFDCEFVYYRNATNTSGAVWCLQDLWEDPSQPSPSVQPHLTSPAIVKLQAAVPCDPYPRDTPRPLVWMPLNFYVSTNNVVALTSVAGGLFDANGTCQGLMAANVRFSSMSVFLMSLVHEARYANLGAMLVETQSEKVLGTSIGSAIYKENQTLAGGTTEEYEVAASLAQMEYPLIRALYLHINNTYGSVKTIPTPLITSASLEGQEYFLYFHTFSRPMLNLTIFAFIPVTSITGPAEAQRQDVQVSLEASAEDLGDSVRMTLVLQIILGVGGLLACAAVASLTAMYLSSRMQALMDFMERLRSQLSNLANKNSRSGSTVEDLCEPLPSDFFPVFEPTHLKDLNKIRAATDDLCTQLLGTWNTKQHVFRQALEQRQFTASIAHDIRNPLHGILGIISLMQTNMEEHKDKLPLLEQTVNHMATLLNDIVDLSKIQGGKVTYVKNNFDAWDILYEVRTLYEDGVASSGGILSCAERSTLPPAYADPVHVKRIMTNFVSNAVKYAPGCEIRLNAVVASRQQVQNLTFLQDLGRHFGGDAPHWSQNAVLEHDQYIVLACLDKGRGILSSKLNDVFVAYQQSHASDRNQGAGLGLAIVRGLAVDMEGGTGLQSQVGHGSIFWLVVPCSSANEQGRFGKDCSHNSISTTTESSPQVPVSPIFERDSSGRKPHVLVVDDIKLNAMLLRNFLSRLGIDSEIATCSLDGLRMLRQYPTRFSLILSDFDMPEMHGGDFCLEVRKDKHLCHLPFICTSGSILPMDVTVRYRMDETMLKPFTIDKVRETIEPYLGRRSKWSQSPDSESTPIFDRDKNV